MVKMTQIVCAWLWYTLAYSLEFFFLVGCKLSQPFRRNTWVHFQLPVFWLLKVTRRRRCMIWHTVYIMNFHFVGHMDASVNVDRRCRSCRVFFLQVIHVPPWERCPRSVGLTKLQCELILHRCISHVSICSIYFMPQIIPCLTFFSFFIVLSQIFTMTFEDFSVEG